jgi:fatty-acyl-CoA synthase
MDKIRMSSLTREFELDWLKRWNVYRAKEVALVDAEPEPSRAYTYEELFSGAKKLAYWLRDTHGVQRGDRVAVVAQNHPTSIFLFFAVGRLGATLVPINFRLTANEINYILDNCEPKCVIGDSDLKEKLPNHSVEIETLVDVIKTHVQEFDAFESLPSDIAMILYTSGTTGFPKGAMLSHEALFWNSINTSLRLNLTEDDRAVIFLPLFHTGGWNVLTTPLFHRGAQIILVKKFTPEKVLALNADYQCTLLFGVPTTMRMLAQLPDFDSADLRSVRYAIVGGEPMPIDLIRTWQKKGIPIRQGYGLTEFGPNVFSLSEKDSISKIGSIGFPNFYVDAKVIDDQGHALGCEQIGELALKGPVIMTGYWRNEKATAETIKDGWLMTGDLVKKDKEGYFFVVGRKKDMFISGGENVYPSEVEQVISAVPEVLEVAVVGVPDPKWGEVGRAFLVGHSGLTDTDKAMILEKIKQHCAENLAKFKIPKYFEWRDSLPKGDSGKIIKRALI